MSYRDQPLQAKRFTSLPANDIADGPCVLMGCQLTFDETGSAGLGDQNAKLELVDGPNGGTGTVLCRWYIPKGPVQGENRGQWIFPFPAAGLKFSTGLSVVIGSQISGNWALSLQFVKAENP